MFLRKYGVQTDLIFPAVKAGAVDFSVAADWTPATGDTKVSKDGGNVANTTNNPAAVGGTGSALWKLTLTATEMQAALVVVQIVDSATKAIEDQAIAIETYGHASAQHALDLDTAITVSNGLVQADIRAIDTDQSVDTKLKDTLIALDPYTSTFQAGSTTTALVLNSGASSVDDFYNGSMIYFFNGDPARQVRKIIDYDGTSRTATLDRPLVTNAPAAGDFYIILHNYDNAPEDLADTLLRRPTSDVETGWTEDARTLYGVIAALMHKHERDAGDNNIVLYKSDDSTTLATIPITKDSSLTAIKAIDPP